MPLGDGGRGWRRGWGEGIQGCEGVRAKTEVDDGPQTGNAHKQHQAQSQPCAGRIPGDCVAPEIWGRCVLEGAPALSPNNSPERGRGGKAEWRRRGQGNLREGFGSVLLEVLLVERLRRQ